MSSAEAAARRNGAPRILCTGIIVLDEVFRVEEFPQADGKVQANGFFVVNGGCAANAAVAIARLGGRAALAGPMGGPGRRRRQWRPRAQGAGARRSRLQLLSAHRRAGNGTVGDFHECAGRPHHRDLSRRADRQRPGRRSEGRSSPMPTRFWPITAIRISCSRSAKPRTPAALPVVLDGDRPTVEDDPLFRLASHVIFSSECLRETTGVADLGDGLQRIARKTDAFLAVSNGPDDIIYLEAARSAACRCFRSPPWTRSAPAMRFMAALRWRWRKAKARSLRCASALPSPASSAAGSAVRPARRRGRKSRRSWPKSRAVSSGAACWDGNRPSPGLI